MHREKGKKEGRRRSDVDTTTRQKKTASLALDGRSRRRRCCRFRMTINPKNKRASHIWHHHARIQAAGQPTRVMTGSTRRIISTAARRLPEGMTPCDCTQSHALLFASSKLITRIPPLRHDDQQIDCMTPSSLHLPPSSPESRPTSKRTAQSSAAPAGSCPRGQVTGAPIRGGIPRQGRSAASPYTSQLHALLRCVTTAPGGPASHVARLLVPSRQRSRRPNTRPSAAQGALATSPSARDERPTAGRHGKCPHPAPTA